MKRHVCIHGHFYQPPRENAWLEEVELQDSAYPYPRRRVEYHTGIEYSVVLQVRSSSLALLRF